MGQGRRLVSWTFEARDCLEEVIGFIASDSPEAAGRVLNVILDAAESLALMAERGRVVPELDDDSIREIFVYSYRLIFRVSSGEVQILTVIHGAMDFKKILASEPDRG